MTVLESASVIGHRHRCSWGNIQEPWIPQVLRFLLEFRVKAPYEKVIGSRRQLNKKVCLAVWVFTMISAACA